MRDLHCPIPFTFSFAGFLCRISSTSLLIQPMQLNLKCNWAWECKAISVLGQSWVTLGLSTSLRQTYLYDTQQVVVYPSLSCGYAKYSFSNNRWKVYFYKDKHSHGFYHRTSFCRADSNAIIYKRMHRRDRLVYLLRGLEMGHVFYLYKPCLIDGLHI